MRYTIAKKMEDAIDDTLELSLSIRSSGEAAVCGKDANGDRRFLLKFTSEGTLCRIGSVWLKGIQCDDQGRIMLDESKE